MLPEKSESQRRYSTVEWALRAELSLTRSQLRRLERQHRRNRRWLAFAMFVGVACVATIWLLYATTAI